MMVCSFFKIKINKYKKKHIQKKKRKKREKKNHACEI